MLLWLVFALASSVLHAAAPSYSADGIVNAASGEAGALAPHTLATLTGTDLAYAETKLAQNDIRGDTLPTELGGVSIRVGNIFANLYYVSPTQINFLIPASLRPGEMSFQLVREGTKGPLVTIKLADAAPALFPIATHLDGAAVTAESPAEPGEIVVFYATGLGPVQNPIENGRTFSPPNTPPLETLYIQRISDFRLLLGENAVAPDRVLYAGLSPGSAGVYQVNVLLPDELEASPEVRIALGEVISPPGFKLPTRTAEE